jgi:hypothetical protein
VGRRIERIHFFEAGCAGIAAIVPQLLTGGAAAYAPQNETNAMVLVITEALAALRAFKPAGKASLLEGLERNVLDKTDGPLLVGDLVGQDQQQALITAALFQVGAVHERFGGSLHLDHSVSILAGLVAQSA